MNDGKTSPPAQPLPSLFFLLRTSGQHCKPARGLVASDCVAAEADLDPLIPACRYGFWMCC